MPGKHEPFPLDAFVYHIVFIVIMVRREGRWVPRKYPWYAPGVSKQIVKFQNFLAIQKYVLDKDGRSIDTMEEVRLLRDEITVQKQGQAAPQAAARAQGR